jgi:hypothetical protein
MQTVCKRCRQKETVLNAQKSKKMILRIFSSAYRAQNKTRSKLLRLLTKFVLRCEQPMKVRTDVFVNIVTLFGDSH